MACWRVVRGSFAALVAAAVFCGSSGPAGVDRRFLDEHLLVTWYGNPHSRAMGVLGLPRESRSEGLVRQADAYRRLTSRRVVPAYHLVAVIAQPTPGADGLYRRRESAEVIDSLLQEARDHGFALVLDVQAGRAAIRSEVAYLRPWLESPDVHLALDPEFAMASGVPGRSIGSLSADAVNTALDELQSLVDQHGLPPKVLIVHQFTLGMLPDKARIRRAPGVELVLTMDGFGSRALKLSTYQAIQRQHALDFTGFKLFFRQDTGLFTPEDVLALRPAPAVVIYQ